MCWLNDCFKIEHFATAHRIGHSIFIFYFFAAFDSNLNSVRCEIEYGCLVSVPFMCVYAYRSRNNFVCRCIGESVSVVCFFALSRFVCENVYSWLAVTHVKRCAALGENSAPANVDEGERKGKKKTISILKQKTNRNSVNLFHSNCIQKEFETNNKFVDKEETMIRPFCRNDKSFIYFIDDFMLFSTIFIFITANSCFYLTIFGIGNQQLLFSHTHQWSFVRDASESELILRSRTNKENGWKNGRRKKQHTEAKEPFGVMVECTRATHHITSATQTRNSVWHSQDFAFELHCHHFLPFRFETLIVDWLSNMVARIESFVEYMAQYGIQYSLTWLIHDTWFPWFLYIQNHSLICSFDLWEIRIRVTVNKCGSIEYENEFRFIAKKNACSIVQSVCILLNIHVRIRFVIKVDKISSAFCWLLMNKKCTKRERVKKGLKTGVVQTMFSG